METGFVARCWSKDKRTDLWQFVVASSMVRECGREIRPQISVLKEKVGATDLNSLISDAQD